ncbi:Mth938-like domain-containing protein [Polynucleobacter sp. AP-Capit-er-40B-B4]|uniref:Mth938-like domain-containing protein n=1 Tax=Polynucleobacter sp. AP-Capit-er-40B-B4 TaxID=2576927 RepID=UPI001C0B3539|nr:Mth938-like domain-containing protein [Polynucleobacter sp. AP-Capit-er-40B-B4]MBU3580857.1 Mth938-like domain-containing protein [Polynucleobacter sp. AP-Capit-er-40B-B4]
MKLQSDPYSGANTITGYGDGYVEINKTPYAHAVVLSSDGAIAEWAAQSFEDLEAHHFSQLVDLKPELILIGTGKRQRFPKPELVKALISAKIGFEIMDSQAACRTYNILVGEGRQVLLALIVEPV